MYLNLFILALVAFLFGLVAKKIESTVLSGPILFVVIGLILGPSGLGLLQVETGGKLLSVFAELTLALVLFTDASSAKMSVIIKSVRLPERLLLLGLPMTILLGLGVGLVLFGNFSVLEAAILAIILAPTDAALGKAVVTNPKVPVKIRESLNIESGLNDGICVPFLLLCLVFINNSVDGVGISLFFIKAIGIGAIVGLALTYIGNHLISYCEKHGWISESWVRIIIIALALSIFALAEYLGGSGFIACFVGGLLFGVIAKNHKQKLIMAAEGIGDSLALVTWTLFGAAGVGWALTNIEIPFVIYAILSLTIVRMLPVFISLTKSGINRSGKLFMGWFGPRGLASIVFVVMIMNKELPNKDPIALIVVITIFLSVLLHGLSANPSVNWLAKKSNKQ